MASGIEVVFAGLMLICLDGGTKCPKPPDADSFRNTALIIKADGDNHPKPCGVDDNTVTTLKLRMVKKNVTLAGALSLKCDKDEDEEAKIQCILPLFAKGICVLPKSKHFNDTPHLGSGYDLLPRVDEIDRRFGSIDSNALLNPDYVPTRINFPNGAISARSWPPGELPRKWSRSNGVADKVFPKVLADRLSVMYEGSDEIDLAECGNTQPFVEIHLAQNVSNAEVEVSNIADKLSPTTVGSYDDLTYLLWYYRLGSWKSGNCPKYTGEKDGAVVLRCDRGSAGGCSFHGSPDRLGTYWPPYLGPAPD